MNLADWVESTARALHDLAGDTPTVELNANAVLHLHGVSADQLRELREREGATVLAAGGQHLGVEFRRGLGLVVAFWKGAKSDSPPDWLRSQSKVGGR